MSLLLLLRPHGSATITPTDPEPQVSLHRLDGRATYHLDGRADYRLDGRSTDRR